METATWLELWGISVVVGNYCYHWMEKRFGGYFSDTSVFKIMLFSPEKFNWRSCQSAVMINMLQNIVDLSCRHPYRLLVWYWVGSAYRKTWWICFWSSLLQLPAQIWSVCTTLPCPEVRWEFFCFIWWAFVPVSLILCIHIRFLFLHFTLLVILKVKGIAFNSVKFSFSKRFFSVIWEMNWGTILTLPVMWLLSFCQNRRPERWLREWQIYGEESPPSNQ